MAKQFMEDFKANQPESAYALCSDEFKQAASLSMLKNTFAQWRTFTGQPGTPMRVGQWWYGGTGGTRITLAYTVQGSKHLAQVRMVLTSNGGPYRVMSCDYRP